MTDPGNPTWPRPDARHLSADLRLALAESRLARAEAEGIIRSHMIAGSTLVLAPVPLLDGILLFNLQLNLMGRLADHYGIAFDRLYAGIGASLLTAALPVLATGALVSPLKLLPGIGSLGAGATLASLASITSYATGTVVMEHFEAGGTLDDLSTRAFCARFRQALREGRARLDAQVARGAARVPATTDLDIYKSIKRPSAA